jgi:protein-tyrosine phosphatase
LLQLPGTGRLPKPTGRHSATPTLSFRLPDRSHAVGLSTFGRVRLGTVIDLRSRSEVTLAGRFWDHHVRYHNLPLGDPLAEAATVGWSNPEQVAIHYLELLLASDESIGEALAVLTDPAAYPAVIHCSVGKDRTGILVAVLLSLVGVDDGDVAIGYLRAALLESCISER